MARARNAPSFNRSCRREGRTLHLKLERHRFDLEVTLLPRYRDPTTFNPQVKPNRFKD